MDTIKFTLPESNNSDYYDIINGSNELIIRRNEINKLILAIDTKIWNSRKGKKTLAIIRPDVERFVEDALKWKHKASNFILEPHFKFPDNNSLSLAFQHFIDNIRDAVNRTETSISLVESNYNQVSTFIEGQLNFRLAFLSFIIAFAGLIAALIPLFLCK